MAELRNGAFLDTGLALQAQQFRRIDELLKLLHEEQVDASNAAAAQRAALLCGIERNSVMEREELEGLGVKVDLLLEGQQELKSLLVANAAVRTSRDSARRDKRRAMADFEIEVSQVEAEPFGTGGFGAVHRAMFQGEVVALKKMSLAGVALPRRQKLLANFERELAIMVKLRSPRVVLVFGVLTTDPTYFGLVLEYLAGGDLRDALDDLEGCSATFRRGTWLLDVAEGMKYLYARGVEHRDLKCQNVLLTEGRLRAVVSDFGLSTSEELNTAASHVSGANNRDAAGTPAYIAPEVISDNAFTEKSDVYSFSLVNWESLTRDIAWRGFKQAQIVGMVVYQAKRPQVPTDDGHYDHGALVDLMRRCWAQDPDARPGFADVVDALQTFVDRGTSP